MSDDSREHYARFLAGSDLPTWRACMNALVELAVRAGDAERGPRLARALVVTCYVLWLARESGDLGAERAADESSARVRALLHARPPLHLGAAASRCWGVELAMNGYADRAVPLLRKEDDRLDPELLLMVLPGRPVRAVALLRPLFAGPHPCTFLPALHFLCSALATVGSVHEARELVAEHGWDQDNPLLLDIVATTGERLGRWEEALSAYRRSTWPLHRYRAALIAALGGGAAALDLDHATRRFLGTFGNEIDQAELTGRAGFLDACDWSRVDNWVVERELANLSFRRRRFAEAEAHLARALASAPPSARFPLAELRATSLTWLTTGEAGQRLDQTPEAVHAGCEAIKLAGPEDDTSQTRTWIADRTDDLSLLPASFDDWTPYDRAEAYRCVGDDAQAVDGWLASLAEVYSHRSARALLAQLHDAGLRGAAGYLADLVLRESADDFFALWETAEALCGIAVGDEADPGVEQVLTERLLPRLVEFSRLDFTKAIRTYAVCVRAGTFDLAEEALIWATRLAEGVSELLAVATARRPWWRAYGGQEGLSCLFRAAAEARDRLERLEIARELFHYRHYRDARRILESEQVFAAGHGLTHAQFIVVLQCGRWLTAEERSTLARAAARALIADHRADALGDYPALYGRRLVGLIDPAADAAILHMFHLPLVTKPEPTKWAGQRPEHWPQVRERLETALADQDDDAVRTVVHAARHESFGFKLLVVAWLRATLEVLVSSGRKVRPSLPADEIPVRRSSPRSPGPRTVGLCDAWRAYFTGAQGRAAADAQLREFLAEEKEVEARWDRQRRDEAKPVWQRVELLFGLLDQALEQLVTPEETGEPQPVLADLFACVTADVPGMRTELSARRALIRAELGPLPATAPEVRP